jgi:hypothetical protein
MQGQSADERTVYRIVFEQLTRDGQHRRGPKRDASKLTGILYRVLTNDRLQRPALTIQDIRGTGMSEADLRDHLKFLTRFPEERPFLKAERQQAHPHKAGAPLLMYRFEMMWIYEWHQEPEYPPLEATIILEKDDDTLTLPGSESSDILAAWEHFTYLDTINLHNKIKPEGQDIITVGLIRDFQHPPIQRAKDHS